MWSTTAPSATGYASSTARACAWSTSSSPSGSSGTSRPGAGGARCEATSFLEPRSSRAPCDGAAASVVGFVPVPADTDGDVQRHREAVGSAHLAAHELGDLLLLPWRDLQHQLVVHLQQQARRQAGPAQRGV